MPAVSGRGVSQAPSGGAVLADRDGLFHILDFILNRAGRAELEVIRKALTRRMKDRQRGIAGVDIGNLAHKTGAAIQSQFEGKDGIYDLIRSFIVRTLRQQLPDLPEEHLAILLEEWLPKPGGSAPKGAPGGALPQEVLDSMVVQFVDYSRGRMPAADKASLASNWSRRYWEAFSPGIQRLLTELLNGNLNERDFWIAYGEVKKK